MGENGEQVEEPGRDPNLPESIGHYSIISELGIGGQGQVLLAQDTQLDRKVAIKILPPTVGFRHGERFKREAALASRLDHPGICPVYEAGEIQGTAYIAMRYVEGDTLADLIEREKEAKTQSSIAPSSRGALQDTLRLFESTARALHAAHEAGLVHRDIKPGNIMVDKQGNPIIVDFGLAHDESSQEAQQLTFEGDLLGTPAYMSPEQLLAQRIALDRRTDIYSLGITLFECLTLNLPFDAPTRDGIYQQILTSEVPDPTKINRQLSKDIKVVIETACDKDRNRRYQTAEDLAEDLRRVREFKPIRARPIGPLLRFRRWTQRRPALATGVFALFLMLAVGLGISLKALEEVRDREAQTRRTAEYARALALAAEAKETLETDPVLALLLAREAVALRDNARSRSALIAAVGRVNQVAEWRLEGTYPNVYPVSGDRLLLYSAGGRLVLLVDFQGRELRRFEHPYPVQAAVAAQDADRFYTRGFESGQLRLHDLEQSEPVTVFDQAPKSAYLSILPAARRIVYTDTAAADGPVYRLLDWDGTPLMDLPGFVSASPRGDRMVVQGSAEEERDALLIDADGRELRRLPPQILSWAHDGSALFTLRPKGDTESPVRLYDPDGVLVATYDDGLTSIYRSDPARFVTADSEGRQTMHDAAGNAVLELEGEHVYAYNGRDFSEPVDVVAAYAKDESVLRLWSLAGEEIAALSMEARPAALYLDGDRLVHWSQSEYQLLDMSGTRLAELKGFPRFVGNHVVAGDYDHNALRLYDRDGNPVGTLRGHGNGPIFKGGSSDGTRVVTSAQDGTVRLWDLGTSAIPTLRVGTGRLDRWDFVADGTRVAASVFGGAPTVFDLDGTPVATLVHADDPKPTQKARVRFATKEAGTRVLTWCQSEAYTRLWDVDGALLSRFDDTPSYIARFLENGRILTFTRPDDDHRGAILWDRNGRTPTPIGTWQTETAWFWPKTSEHSDRMITMSDESGKAQLVGPDGGVIRALDHAGTTLRSNNNNPWLWGAFLENGNLYLVTQDGDERVMTWFDPDGKKLREALRSTDAYGSWTNFTWTVAWRAGTKTATLLNQHGERVAVLEHEAPIQAVKWSKGEPRLFVSLAGGTTQIWDTAGREVGRLDRSLVSQELEYAAGRIFVRGNDSAAPVLNANGEVIFELRGHTQALTDLDVSPDETLVATCSKDRTVRLWTVDGELVQVMGGFQPITGLAFSPDGKTLLAAYTDGTARLWPLDVDAIRAVADKAAFRGFTPEERARYAELLGD